MVIQEIMGARTHSKKERDSTHIEGETRTCCCTGRGGQQSRNQVVWVDLLDGSVTSEGKNDYKRNRFGVGNKCLALRQYDY